MHHNTVLYNQISSNYRQVQFACIDHINGRNVTVFSWRQTKLLNKTWLQIMLPQPQPHQLQVMYILTVRYLPWVLTLVLLSLMIKNNAWMMRGASNHSLLVYSDTACVWIGWPDSGSRDIDGGADNTGCAQYTTGSCHHHHHCHWTNHCCLHPHRSQHPTTGQSLGTHERGTLLCRTPTCGNCRLYSSVHKCRNYYQINRTSHIHIGKVFMESCTML